jgi:hypothetical protein
MALSDRQIERYSRQIIVPGVGGYGQQRLLAATLAIGGAMAAIETPLAYLVGAGVGTIFVESADGLPIDSSLIDDLRELNPDSRVTPMPELPGRIDLTMLLIGSGADLELARLAIDRSEGGPLMLVRLDPPPRIAVLSSSPCPSCAVPDLLGRFGSRAESAELVAMLATAEAIRMLAGQAQPLPSRLIEFSGYQSQSAVLGRRIGANRCRCESAQGGNA